LWIEIQPLIGAAKNRYSLTKEIELRHDFASLSGIR
jgi:hypothetical protein